MVLKTANGMLLQQPADGRWLAFLAPDGKPTVLSTRLQAGRRRSLSATAGSVRRR